MSTLRLLLHGLLHYWRTNLAVLLGVVAGTAVIGGALVVGDSVRDSLERMSLERLGEVDHAVHSVRFFREQLADDVASLPGFDERFTAVAPLLVMQGSFVRSDEEGGRHRAGSVTVYGVDERVWGLLDHGGVPVPEGTAVVLNSRIAGEDELGAAVGDALSLFLEVPKTIPGESLFGKREGAAVQVELQVAAVLPAERGASRLSLLPSQQLPAVAFVGLDRLQGALDLDAKIDRRTREVTSPARVNALFARAVEEADRAGRTAPEAAGALTDLLRRAWKLDDLQLHVRPYAEHEYVSVESEAMILDDATATAALAVAKTRDRATSPVLVYLANQFEKLGGDPGKFSRYGVVAGIDFATEPPFGPFEYVGEPPRLPLTDDQIVVNSWLARDLDLRVGDRLYLTYHEVGSHGELPELDVDFEVVGIARFEETLAADRGFTPVVKGITDVETYDQWEKPFEMQPVTDRDERYWDAHRATPKAFVSLKRARELWQSRYGAQTSVRLAARSGETANRAAEEVTRTLLAELDPADVGLAFLPVKFTGVRAAAGTTNFTGLFIGFSFFLVAAATILIVLLFRLGIERRSTQVGLLEAVGLSPGQVRRLFLGEGLVVVLIGGLLGVVAAVGYAALMIHGLRTWWSGAIGTRFLDLSVHPASLAIGFAISFLVTLTAIWWALRQLRRLSARELLAGSTEKSLTEEQLRRRGKYAGKVAWIAAGAALLALVGVLTGLIPDDTEAFSGFSWRVVGFFVVGTLLLVASIAELAAYLDTDRSRAVEGRGLGGLTRLGERNASRHRQRSVFTAGLIAAATFVIVAVAAGRQDPTGFAPRKNSGNGGFLLVGETIRGMQYDLSTERGRENLGLVAREDTPDAKLLENIEAVSFRVRPGQDASCLNLYETRLPTVLGAPDKLIEEGGFAFADTPGENPWTLLRVKLPDEQGVPVHPVLGDMNTLMYSLHKGIGTTINVPDDEHPEYKLRVMGMFAGSVFQGVLVMSDESFRTLYPDRSGYEFFLIGGRTRDGASIPPEQSHELADLLETQLERYGFDAEPIGKRLDAFLAVQNTYLQTFQSLGGLGLLLGTLGLATVMLRNVLERRSELALLRAVGFRDGAVAWMVVVENAFLLSWGLVAGTVAALLAMLPQLRSSGADVPWGGIGLLLCTVFVVGMLASLWAVRAAVSTPIVSTLRAE